MDWGDWGTSDLNYINNYDSGWWNFNPDPLGLADYDWNQVVSTYTPNFNNYPTDPYEIDQDQTSRDASNWNVPSAAGTSGGTKSSILDSLLKAAVGFGGAALAGKGTKQAKPGVSQPSINRAIRDATLAGMDPYKAASLALLGQIGFTPDMTNRLQDLLSFLDANRGDKVSASKSLLGAARTPPSLSSHTLAAAELAKRLAEPEREDLERQLDLLGYSRRGYGDAEGIISDAMTKYKTAAMGIEQKVGAQEEALQQAWRGQLPALTQAYEAAYGPDALAKEILLAGMPVDYAIKQLSNLGKTSTDIAQIMANLAKEGQVTVGAQGEQKEWWIPVIEQTLKSLYPTTVGNTSVKTNSPLSDLLNSNSDILGWLLKGG